MNEKYKNSKIYGIYHNSVTLLYIGSTTKTLKRRFAHHKTSMKLEKNKNRSMYAYMLKYPIDEFEIKLIEDYPCNSRNELERREGEKIKQLKPSCNMQIAGRSKKQYQIDNECKIKQYNKDNKVKIIEYQKEYMKQYRKINEDKIKQYKNHKLVCECGIKYTYGNKSNHVKSKKHSNYIENSKLK